MTTILLAVYIFLELLIYIIFIDVILSWLYLFWIKIRPKFIADIIDPIYFRIKKFIPTTFWPIDFTPIVVILLIYFLRTFILILFPDILDLVNLLI